MEELVEKHSGLLEYVARGILQNQSIQRAPDSRGMSMNRNATTVSPVIRFRPRQSN